MSILKTSALLVGGMLAAAYVAGQFTSRTIITEIEIAAPPNAVWAVLSDTQAHREWNPFILSFSGNLEVGSQLSVIIAPPDITPMTFKPTVLEVIEAQELRWIGRMGFHGLFDGEHFFILEETAHGTTRFVHGETFTGMLVHPLTAFLGAATKAGFYAMNVALKDKVEAGV